MVVRPNLFEAIPLSRGMPCTRRTRCVHGDRASLGREARARRGGALQTDHRVTPWHAVHAVLKGVLYAPFLLLR